MVKCCLSFITFFSIILSNFALERDTNATISRASKIPINIRLKQQANYTSKPSATEISLADSLESEKSLTSHTFIDISNSDEKFIDNKFDVILDDNTGNSKNSSDTEERRHLLNNNNENIPTIQPTYRNLPPIYNRPLTESFGSNINAFQYPQSNINIINSKYNTTIPQYPAKLRNISTAHSNGVVTGDRLTVIAINSLKSSADQMQRLISKVKHESNITVHLHLQNVKSDISQLRQKFSSKTLTSSQSTTITHASTSRDMRTAVKSAAVGEFAGLMMNKKIKIDEKKQKIRSNSKKLNKFNMNNNNYKNNPGISSNKDYSGIVRSLKKAMKAGVKKVALHWKPLNISEVVNSYSTQTGTSTSTSSTHMVDVGTDQMQQLATNVSIEVNNVKIISNHFESLSQALFDKSSNTITQAQTRINTLFGAKSRSRSGAKSPGPKSETGPKTDPNPGQRFGAGPMSSSGSSSGKINYEKRIQKEELEKINKNRKKEDLFFNVLMNDPGEGNSDRMQKITGRVEGPIAAARAALFLPPLTTRQMVDETKSKYLNNFNTTTMAI